MTAWNPSAPSVLGPEYLGTRGLTATPTRTAALGLRLASTAAQTIANARIHGQNVLGVSGYGTYLVEVFADGNEVDPGSVETVTYAPNGQSDIVNTVLNQAGSAANLWQSIDEWPPDYTDYVLWGTNASVDFQFASAAYSGGGRILHVALELVDRWGISAIGTATDAARRLVVSVVIGGTAYNAVAKVMPNNAADGSTGRTLWTLGEINPSTTLPWTAADIALFDSTTEFRLARQTADAGQVQVAAARLVIIRETAERRLAVGRVTANELGTTERTWSSEIVLRSPAGVVNWSKASATTYAVTLRQADLGPDLNPASPNTLLCSLVEAASGESPAAVQALALTGSIPTVFLDANASLTSPQLSTDAAVPGQLLPLLFRTTAPATSADGQPYATVEPVPVYTGSGSTQGEITSTVADDFKSLLLVCGYDLAPPSAPLLVNVRRRSDNVSVAQLVLDHADPQVTATGGVGAGAVCELTTDPEALFPLAITQYYLDFTSTTPAANRWVVGLLAGVGTGGSPLTNADIDPATFGGATDVADPIGGVAASALDFAPGDFAALLTAPVDAPGSFAATADVDPIEAPGDCALDGVPFVELTWTGPSPALGADFGYYQLQRLGTDGSTWEDIAVITDEDVVEFADYEGRLGVEECYRARTFRSDGASSFWTDTECATAPTAGCGYTFTTNEAPELNVAYADVYDRVAEREYAFAEADEVVLRTMLGRDYHVAFRPLAHRGVAFSRLLLIGALTAPVAGVGPPAVDALRQLARATVSYVCVRDNDGNRWYGSIAVPSLTARQPAQLHRATLRFVETTATPSAPDAAA